MSRVAVVFTGGTISMQLDPVAGGNVPTLDGAAIWPGPRGWPRSRGWSRSIAVGSGQPLPWLFDLAAAVEHSRWTTRPPTAWSSSRAPTSSRRPRSSSISSSRGGQAGRRHQGDALGQRGGDRPANPEMPFERRGTGTSRRRGGRGPWRLDRGGGRRHQDPYLVVETFRSLNLGPLGRWIETRSSSGIGPAGAGCSRRRLPRSRST